MATGSYSSVHIYNTKTFAKLASLLEDGDYNVGGSEVRAISFSPNGQRLAIGRTAIFGIYRRR